MASGLYSNWKFVTNEIPLCAVLGSALNPKDLIKIKYDSLQLVESGKPAFLMNAKKEKREYKMKKLAWQFK